MPPATVPSDARCSPAIDAISAIVSSKSPIVDCVRSSVVAANAMSFAAAAVAVSAPSTAAPTRSVDAQFVHDPADIARGFAGRYREFADLQGNQREPRARLGKVRRFDRRVDREELRLSREPAERREEAHHLFGGGVHLADRAATGRQSRRESVQRAADLAQPFGGPVGGAGRLNGKPLQLLGRIGDLARAGRSLRHRSGGAANEVPLPGCGANDGAEGRFVAAGGLVGSGDGRPVRPEFRGDDAEQMQDGLDAGSVFRRGKGAITLGRNPVDPAGKGLGGGLARWADHRGTQFAAQGLDPAPAYRVN